MTGREFPRGAQRRGEKRKGVDQSGERKRAVIRAGEKSSQKGESGLTRAAITHRGFRRGKSPI
jgi:hypothetical protein